MPFDKRLYPPDWDVQRERKIAEVGHRCQECGIEEYSLRMSPRTQRPYPVYLSIAHKRQYETWKPDAETMVLCQRCHRRYDRQFRRKGRVLTPIPIGYAKIYALLDGQQVLVGMPHTFADVCGMVQVLPDEVAFAIDLVVNLHTVGQGFYRKHGDRIDILDEYGACEGLPF